MDELLLLEKKADIAVITINNPSKKNALSEAALVKLHEVLHLLEKDSQVRVAIFTGSGNEAFCAGADLKERALMNETEVFSFVKNIQDNFNRIANLPYPTIAAINGVAFGGGLELALACDIRLADFNSQMGLTECSLGIIPGAGGTQRLGKIVGIAKACELIFTAKKLTAQEAFEIKLLNKLASPEEGVLSLALNMAKVIALQAPLAIKAAKKAMIKNNINKNDLNYELLCYKEVLYTKDRIEGLKAFLEKRKPAYIGE